jgi:hypothetical protein
MARSAKQSEQSPVDPRSRALQTLGAKLPDVKVAPKANHVSLLVGKQVFAYSTASGIVLKLPAARVTALVEAGRGAPLVMGARTMKEWVVLDSVTAALLGEARAFVAGRRAP